MISFRRMMILGVVLVVCSVGCSRDKKAVEKASDTKASDTKVSEMKASQPHETRVSGKTTSARAASQRSSRALQQERTAPPDEVIHALATPWPFGSGGPADDADRDGVADAKDRCLNTRTGARVTTAGCPLDADGDGVPDGIDRCDRTAKGARVDATGCPAGSERAGIHRRG